MRCYPIVLMPNQNDEIERIEGTGTSDAAQCYASHCSPVSMWPSLALANLSLRPARSFQSSSKKPMKLLEKKKEKMPNNRKIAASIQKATVLSGKGTAGAVSPPEDAMADE